MSAGAPIEVDLGRSMTRLLDALDPDARQAGEKYQQLRRKLVKFFEWRGAVSPEEQADETLDRASRRLDQGERVCNICNYCYGIAKLVLLEAQRHAQRERTVLDSREQSSAMVDDGELASAASCLECCLSRLTPGERRLILGYYRGERFLKIQARQRLAFQLGISSEALRIRVYRLRARLGSCMENCMGAGNCAKARVKRFSSPK